jgi:Mn-dependent DtxR family transcriptional regulator
MSQKKTSKEERFLKKLYHLDQKNGGSESGIDRYQVGKLIGENTKGTDNTVQMLAKNGFLKRGEEGKVYLTSRGIHFAKSLE